MSAWANLLWEALQTWPPVKNLWIYLTVESTGVTKWQNLLEVGTEWLLCPCWSFSSCDPLPSPSLFLTCPLSLWKGHMLPRFLFSLASWFADFQLNKFWYMYFPITQSRYGMFLIHSGKFPLTSSPGHSPILKAISVLIFIIELRSLIEFHLNGITYYILSGVWLLSFNLMFLRLIHVVVCNTSSIFCITLLLYINNIYLWIFIHHNLPILTTWVS